MKRAILLTTSSIVAVIAALAAIAVVVVASGNSALAASSLVNGNFETGDLSGWTVDTTNGGTASAVTSYDYGYYRPCYPGESWYGEPCGSGDTMRPHEGSYFALLRTGNPQYTKISHPFKASKGDKVSGWAFFDTDNFGGYDDKGQVVIKSASGTTIGKAFEESVSSVYGRNENSGWKYWEYPFTEEGDFQVEARVATVIYNGNYFPGVSVIGLDDVKTGINDAPADTTKPSTTATRSVEPNAAGWNKENVTVKLKATDNEGGWGVRDITYRINGGQPTTEVGDSVEVPAITAEGESTIAYYATDKAGNVEDEQSLKVKIDKTPPIVKSTSPAKDATGVSPSAKISVTFLESGSGIKPSTITSEGNYKSFAVYKMGGRSGSEQISGTTSYDEALKTATFTPRSRLVKGTYIGTINGLITDKAGYNLNTNNYETWYFYVG